VLGHGAVAPDLLLWEIQNLVKILASGFKMSISPCSRQISIICRLILHRTRTPVNSAFSFIFHEFCSITHCVC